jgi:hypothetical protein
MPNDHSGLLPAWLSEMRELRERKSMGFFGEWSGLKKSEQLLAVYPDDEQQDGVVVTVEMRLRSTPK